MTILSVTLTLLTFLCLSSAVDAASSVQLFNDQFCTSPQGISGQGGMVSGQCYAQYTSDGYSNWQVRFQNYHRLTCNQDGTVKYEWFTASSSNQPYDATRCDTVNPKATWTGNASTTATTCLKSPQLPWMSVMIQCEEVVHTDRVAYYYQNSTDTYCNTTASPIGPVYGPPISDTSCQTENTYSGSTWSPWSSSNEYCTPDGSKLVKHRYIDGKCQSMQKSFQSPTGCQSTDAGRVKIVCPTAPSLPTRPWPPVDDVVLHADCGYSLLQAYKLGQCGPSENGVYYTKFVCSQDSKLAAQIHYTDSNCQTQFTEVIGYTTGQSCNIYICPNTTLPNAMIPASAQLPSIEVPHVKEFSYTVYSNAPSHNYSADPYRDISWYIIGAPNPKRGAWYANSSTIITWVQPGGSINNYTRLRQDVNYPIQVITPDIVSDTYFNGLASGTVVGKSIFTSSYSVKSPPATINFGTATVENTAISVIGSLLSIVLRSLNGPALYVDQSSNGVRETLLNDLSLSLRVKRERLSFTNITAYSTGSLITLQILASTFTGFPTPQEVIDDITNQLTTTGKITGIPQSTISPGFTPPVAQGIVGIGVIVPTSSSSSTAGAKSSSSSSSSAGGDASTGTSGSTTGTNTASSTATSNTGTTSTTSTAVSESTASTSSGGSANTAVASSTAGSGNTAVGPDTSVAPSSTSSSTGAGSTAVSPSTSSTNPTSSSTGGSSVTSTTSTGAIGGDTSTSTGNGGSEGTGINSASSVSFSAFFIPVMSLGVLSVI